MSVLCTGKFIKDNLLNYSFKPCTVYLNIWHMSNIMLSFRGHLKFSQQVCDELGVLASSVTGVDMELKTEASLRRARTLLAANQFSEV